MNNYPAPWNLTGYGYMLLYAFKKDFSNEHSPGFLKGNTTLGFGSVMLVNYEQSNCGPYGELLIIPGKYTHQTGTKKEKINTISKIYVSSQSSVENGRKNWGIPKELASFNFQSISANEERVTIQTDVNGTSTRLFEATFKSNRLAFPVNTALLPFPLLQHMEQQAFYTTFSGKGMGHFASMTDVCLDERLFPNILTHKPIAIIKIDPFNITFPKARIMPIS